MRVLILEPDEELLESFGSYFKHATDFEIRLAASGEECIEQLRRFSPQVLVMEPALPPGVAQQVLRAIGKSHDRPFVPVLVFTRYSENTTADYPCVKEFLVKPQSLKTLASAIERLAAEADD